MKFVNELATNQAERQSKLDSKPARGSAAMAITGPTQPKQNTAKENSQQNDLLLVEIRETKSYLSTLKQQVNFSGRPGNSQAQGWSQGRGRFRGNQNGVKKAAKSASICIQVTFVIIASFAVPQIIFVTAVLKKTASRKTEHH